MCLAIPGKVIEVFEAQGLRMARADFGGTIRKVCLAYLPEAGLGDYILIHAGLAIARVDPDQAQETLSMLRDLADEVY